MKSDFNNGNAYRRLHGTRLAGAAGGFGAADAPCVTAQGRAPRHLPLGAALEGEERHTATAGDVSAWMKGPYTLPLKAAIEEYVDAKGRSSFKLWFDGLVVEAGRITVALQRIGRGRRQDDDIAVAKARWADLQRRKESER